MKRAGHTTSDSRDLLRSGDHALLLRLLRTPTTGPLETGQDPQRRWRWHWPRHRHGGLWQAQRAYARAARAAGLRVVHHAGPPADVLRRADVPAVVRRHAAADPHFLARQPNLVLRLGPDLPRAATVMFNVHLDTVAGLEPVGFDGTRFTGRGAIDAKGPAVALLAGVRAARAACPLLGREIAVLIQAVGGEEGGAMGVHGTRPLVESGFTGRLNVFCEPTGLRYLPRATAAMTARVTVAGQDAVDDRPEHGHNASVLLGFLAQHLAAALDGRTADGRVCVAGLHTGDLHNRVYGQGRLLINLSYATAGQGTFLERAVTEAVADGLRVFTARFADSRQFARTAADAAAVTRLEWDKRGLPCLTGADLWAESLLSAAGASRWPDDEPAFTCDAIWAHGLPDAFTAVLGPGRLEDNHAHATGEFADVADLEAFAHMVSRLLITFAERAL
ncbi:M20/M25/M40 family metallo-hydrolase [Streptomyces sp. NPDC048484]|uniref:M20/M25/M40 family metallo-hydrolase n=1 Tax=Streptomyces sp. NPDC048484 TaxID=3155146 RepID=UPI00343A4DBB